MFGALKRHPFPVLARFERVLALSFAFPREVLEPMVPKTMEIDALGDLGFVTAALVWTRGLRPAALPAFLGQDFFLAGYRIFVRTRDPGGRRLRGLRILRSETDKRRMVAAGNLLTHYNYRRIVLDEGPDRVTTRLPGGGITLDVEHDLTDDSGLPDGSPFSDWREARKFAGPMPFTFDNAGGGRIVAIEGRRASWAPRSFRVLRWDVGLFKEPAFHGCEPVLANAFQVSDIDYRWEKGRLFQPEARSCDEE